MKTQGYFFIIMVALAFFACEPPTPAPEPKIHDEWTYNVTLNDIMTGDFVIQTNISFTAYENIQDDKSAWAFLKRGPSIIYESLPGGTFRMGPGGLWYISTTPQETVKAPFLKYPGSVGEGYDFHFSNGYT